MKAFLTIKELKEKLENKEISKEQILDFYLSKFKKHNPELNAVLETFDKESIKKNTSLKGELLGGIPCILKNNICQRNRLTTCASKILRNYVSPYDATVTRKLKKSGAFILGNANMDEFAMGSSGEYSAFGPTKNPWNKEYVSGGSSSGSAAAVAAGLVPFALGSETGGSVRVPASFCNLVGLYPTYGTNSRYGLIALASSLDQIGPLTKTVYDNALVLSAIAGQDTKDSTTLSRRNTDFTKDLTGKLPPNLTLGIIKESLNETGIDAEVLQNFKTAINQLEKLGAKIKYISMPNLKYGLSVYFIINRAEAASNLAKYDGTLYGLRNTQVKDLIEMYTQTRHEGFGIEVKRRILLGNYVLSSSQKDAFYNKANKVREIIRTEFEDSFNEVDLLVSPTMATLPFKLGKISQDPIKMQMSDFFSVPNNISGNPSLSLSCGFSKENLPIGFQFIGPRLSENLIYQVAYAYEQSTDHHLKHPKGFD